MKKYILFGIVISILLNVSIYSKTSKLDRRIQDKLKSMELSPPKHKTKAPNITLTSIDTNKKVSLQDYRGKIVFLNFWATWCPPCREEMPAMEELYNKMKGKDFVMLAVSYEEVDTLKDFKKEYGYTFPILQSTDAELKFGIGAIPATFIIDKKGYIIARRVGAYYWNDDDSIKLFNMLAKQ